MRILRPALLVAVALAACSPNSRSIPRYDDTDGAVRAMQSLSPWEDGSPDRSHDKRTLGQRGSDRQTFFRWFRRYIENETGNQYSRTYEPFPVPRTIAEAIVEQRAFESDRAVKAEAARAEHDAEQARVAAAAERSRQLGEQQEAEEQARVATQRAEDDRQWEHQLQVNAECRKRRQVAADDWLRGGASTSKGTYAEVWASFQCGEQ